jgi:hypothetical protein
MMRRVAKIIRNAGIELALAPQEAWVFENAFSRKTIREEHSA